MRCVSPVRLWGLPGVWGLLFCALGMAFLEGRTEAAYFVKEDGRGDGASWENAGNLQAMLNAPSADFGRDPAQRPVDVHVAAGAYKGVTLVLPRGVKLWGGYPATLGGSSPTVVNTILWGNGADTEGPALFLYNLSVRPPVLRNCVMPLGGDRIRRWQCRRGGLGRSHRGGPEAGPVRRGGCRNARSFGDPVLRAGHG